MPLPASWTLITVTATYTQRDGDPATGSVVFVSPQVVVVDGETVVPRSVVGTLDANGDLSVQLPSTDDPDIAPTGWTWLVRERIDGLVRDPYAIEVPHDGGPIDLATVAPVEGVVDLVDLANVWTASQTLESSFEGGDNNFDSTSRLTVQSHQRSVNPDHFGEGVRLDLMRDTAKNVVAWRDAFTDPDNPRSVAWVGAHDLLSAGNEHKHWSVEVSDAAGLLQTRLEIPYDLDHTNIKTAGASLSVSAEDGSSVLRIGGSNGVRKDLQFSIDADGGTANQRWAVRANNTSEAGGNSGTDFEIVRYSDTGVALDAPVRISRATGNVELESDLTFDDNNNGPVLTDRTTGAQFRLFVDNGVLDIEAV